MIPRGNFSCFISFYLWTRESMSRFTYRPRRSRRTDITLQKENQFEGINNILLCSCCLLSETECCLCFTLGPETDRP